MDQYLRLNVYENPLFRLKYYNPCRDLPCDVLHVELLGLCKSETSYLFDKILRPSQRKLVIDRFKVLQGLAGPDVVKSSDLALLNWFKAYEVFIFIF